MYPNTPTHTEELINILKQETPDKKDVIMDYIAKHDTSQMTEGVRYYFNDSDIQKRPIWTYENGVKVADTEATNNKVPTGWHKTLVDQKTAYLASEALSINSEEDNDPNLDAINEILGDDFDDIIPELIKGASNKGREWLHVYIAPNGEFEYMIVPAQEFIPIYDNTKRKNLIGGIRYYELDDETMKVELWDDKQVTYYEEINGKLEMDMSYEVNPEPHFYYGDDGYSWSTDDRRVIPFIEFANNEERVSDLIFYKELIDAFEKVISDTSNTLEDVQSFIYVLKGYEGTDLEQFKTELKRYKVISVSDEPGAGVDTVRAEIPIDAVDSHLDRLTEMIYQAGQGVNHSTDKFGQSPSGVALKFLYSFLDMKAGVLERKFGKSLKQLMWFVCEYLSIAENIDTDYKQYSFTWNKSMITNKSEQVAMAKDSQGVISEETIVANHPWVDNVQLEMERKQKEKDEYMQNMPSVGEVDEPGAD